MNDEVYDYVGIALACSRPGKYKTVRIGILHGDLVILKEITDNRALSRALDAAVHELELLATDVSRGKVSLTEPKQLKLKFE